MSYFPSDIPYMTDNELEEHGINAKREQGMEQELGKPAKDFNEIIECMRETVQKKVEDAYQRGYDKGYADKINNDEVCKELAKDIYQRGLDDAWEAARKIALGLNDGGFSTHYLKEVFGSISFQYAFKNYSASEAIEKLKAYEEKQKAEDGIKVGDEVEILGTGNKFFIVGYEDDCICGFAYGGKTCRVKPVFAQKTGRHIDVDKILEALKE